MAKKLRITQVGSAIGRNFDQKGTLKALGIRKMNQTVIKDDTAQIRGMIRKISHLLVVEEVEDAENKKEKKAPSKDDGKKTEKESKKKADKKTDKKTEE
jgi:large subunit ribosomal protein L30